ncbi:MFS transporter [uncultured Lutibacter sp.]|uniref:MFS transporter n=1 Tax=Seonamhaeicola sp. TaxID=1912245 RepID=UPI00260E0480|nr:MFS transporter [uncultured Lutibacter sp.]
MKFTQVFKKFPRAFWVANTMELFERWAWYGLFAVLALYLTNSTDDGALGFTQSQKGSIMGTVTGILYLLPLITGAIADRIGYKKVLIIAYIILGSGYFFMGEVSSYGLVYFAFLWVALGAALFKPVISATITKTTDDETSSIGFGIFYMMVNIGGFIGPIFSSKLREAYGWKIVFLMAASAIAVNLILVLFFYKEPEREKSTESLGTTLKKSLTNIVTALADKKLTLFLLIMVGFWTMFNQLFYTLPNFIDQWVNTSVIYDSIANISPKLAAAIGTKDGTIAPEMMVNLDAGAIILFQILISTLVMRFKPLNGIISGIIVNAIGIGLAFSTGNGFFVILGIFIFALGEMASSPKFTEYVGKIAPKGKEALYMGTSFLPVAVGNYVTGFLSGDVYQAWSDKISLLQTEVAKRGLEIQEIGDGFSQNDYIAKAGELMGMTNQQLTDFLWTSYNPSKIWMLFSAIGIGTVICLYLYDKFIIGTVK